MNIRLDAKDFELLVNGKKLTIDNEVHIILADIGYLQMLKIIIEAIKKEGRQL